MTEGTPPLRALITGITGQDGSYLAELLLAKGYEVHGAVRRQSSENFERIEGIRPRLHLHEADLLDLGSLLGLLRDVAPRELYNLAAQSSVGTSWIQPVLTAEVTALGVTRVLEAVRAVDPTIRVYQASSSEMFGMASQSPQRETTPFYPRSPYGVAKVYGHWISVNYRESYDLFCVSGILFNHESPRRGRQFVSRRISEAVARIKLGIADELTLGNMAARRDWGYAPEYVEAMWRMLQRDTPSDYVVGSGEQHTVAEFADLAFAYVGLAAADFVRVDRGRFRPAEVDGLCADTSKAQRDLGWKPQISFAELVQLMVEADLERWERRTGRRRGDAGTR